MSKEPNQSSKSSLDLRAKVSELDISGQVQTVTPDASVLEVRKILQESRIGSIVVTDDEDKVLGIFTERDYLMKIAGKEPKLGSQAIASVMTPKPKCVVDDQQVTEVLELMHNGGFRHVIVVNRENKVVGVISIKDLMDFLLSTITNLEEALEDVISCVS